MDTPLLSLEERESLQTFVDRSSPGTPYLRRARILLLADDKMTQETIAAEVEVSITRVRQMLRAFNRERLALFPKELFSSKSFSADETLAEAGRSIMGGLVIKALFFESDLATTTSDNAVHETRKTIRRLRTSFKLFEPYYEDGLLSGYQRRFRKAMRRLGRSRDRTVFLTKLGDYIEQESISGSLAPEEIVAFRQLSDYWQAKKTAADEKVRRYLAKGKYQALLLEFESFTKTRDMGVRTATNPLAPTIVSHVAPVLIYEKVAAVRAYDAYLDGGSLNLLHALRIQLKELRYTLEFFRPVMGPSATEAIETVKNLLTHLGDLNDARVHLEMMADIDDEEPTTAVILYRRSKELELSRLVAEVSMHWTNLEDPEWRLQVASAIAAM